MATKRRSSKPAKPSAKPQASTARLAALVDGARLSDDEARTLWQAFSTYMDEHEGDLDGFATTRGWRSVKPEYRDGRAVLVVTT